MPLASGGGVYDNAVPFVLCSVLGLTTRLYTHVILQLVAFPAGHTVLSLKVTCVTVIRAG